MGVPILMKLIALRLVVIGAVDPTFRTDHVYDTEMERHRNVLLDQMRTMLDGVRCDQHDYLVTTLPVGGLPAPTIAWGCNLACADVHSGIAGQFLFHPSWSQLDRRCPSTTGTQEFIDKRNTLIAQVIAKMPIAEMRMLIDRLYTFRHPAPDLTAALGRIANEDQNLCIEVAGGLAAAGTPLQLAACNGSNAQNWSYNRQTGQIVNPALGTCIDVATGNPLPNATVHSWPCSGVAGDPPQATNPNQVWSYDPENKQLHSVFGTVLKADFIGAGAPMKTFLNVLPFTVVPSVPFGSPTPSVTVQPQQERWVADEHNRKDFNGDLHTDVLWHNPDNGNLQRVVPGWNDRAG